MTGPAAGAGPPEPSAPLAAPAALSMSVSAAIASALVLPTLVLVYAAVRVLQAWLYPEPDPATVIWSTRIGLFWRLGLCGYVGLMLLPLGLRWARRDPVGAARTVAWLVPVSAVALALQAGWVP